MDNATRHELRTAIIGRELARSNADIVALAETRLSGESHLIEVGGGYTFYWVGVPDGHPHKHGVGFAVKTSLVKDWEVVVKGISTRLMTLRIRLSDG